MLFIYILARFSDDNGKFGFVISGIVSDEALGNDGWLRIGTSEGSRRLHEEGRYGRDGELCFVGMLGVVETDAADGTDLRSGERGEDGAEWKAFPGGCAG